MLITDLKCVLNELERGGPLNHFFIEKGTIKSPPQHSDQFPNVRRIDRVYCVIFIQLLALCNASIDDSHNEGHTQ
jgi:hypothetical protein